MVIALTQNRFEELVRFSQKHKNNFLSSLLLILKLDKEKELWHAEISNFSFYCILSHMKWSEPSIYITKVFIDIGKLQDVNFWGSLDRHLNLHSKISTL